MKKQEIDQTTFLAKFAEKLLQLGFEEDYTAEACAVMLASLTVLEELGKVKLIDL